MGKLLGFAAVVMGAAGTLLCAAAIGVGWWETANTISRIDRVVARLNAGLSEAEKQLDRVDSRVNAVRGEFDAVLTAAEEISEANDLPRAKAEIERLFERLGQSFERLETLADSLQSSAAAIRLAADLLDQFLDDSEATSRARGAADKIDRAAESLNGLRARIRAPLESRAVELVRETIDFARQAIAHSELLAEGLAAAQQQVSAVRGRITALRNRFVFYISIAAVAGTFAASWFGLGQLCLIGWGRRQFKRPTT